MFPLSYTLFMFFKVILAFFIIYIFLPSRLITFDECGDEWIDKVFISLTHSNFAIIVLIHLLVVFRIYETISLAIALIIIVILIALMKNDYIIFGNKSDKNSKNILAFFLDFADGKFGFFSAITTYGKKTLTTFKQNLRSGFIHFFIHPLDGILLLGVFVFAAVIRFRHAFENLYFGASDCYVHLAWTKYLGVNQIYKDGVYPYGYEAILSAINKLFFIDPVIIIRFFGGIGSVLMVLSIYYIVKKNMKNQFVIMFVAVAAYVLGTELPNEANNLWRQMSALPQEYATLFMLPGIHFLNLFFTTNKRKYLILSAEVLAITVFIHFYAAIFVAIAYIFVSLMNVNKVFKGKTFLMLLVSFFAAGVIGIAPVGIALLLGMKLHALSASFVTESATVATKIDWKQEIFRFTETNQTMSLLLMSIAIIVGFSIIRLLFKKSPELSGKIKLFISLAFMGLLLYTQVRSPEIGFPSIMEFSRASTFLGVFMVVVYAIAMYLIEMIPIHRLIRYGVKVFLGVYIIMNVFNIANYKVFMPVGAKLEYNEAAYAYYKIKQDYPLLNWTIISPVEQYQQSLGYGWHYNLWEFVKDTQIEPKDKVEFPTDYVFIIVEKHPLNQAEPNKLTAEISKNDANQPFPNVGLAYDKYYTNYKNRRIIEAKTYYWVEDYMKRTNKFSVFMENDLIKIYKMQQDGTKPVNLAK